MKSHILAIGLFLFVTLAGAPAIWAQATGGLSGVVADPNGALVQGANVTVKNTATNLTRNAVTNDDGRWTITILPVGTYSVSYEKEGFKKAQSAAVNVEASVTRSIDVTLEVGVSDVFVDVTSDQALVQAETAAVTRQITGDQLTKTPTSTRSFTGILSSESGVSVRTFAGWRERDGQHFAVGQRHTNNLDEPFL